MNEIQIRVEIRTQPVRLAQPCIVAVALTNQLDRPVLVNKRLAVGYRDSTARELFVDIFKPHTDEVVGQQALLYERDFSGPDDYVWLAPGATLSTSFDLFEWYHLPSVGEYELVVSYQADEPGAFKPDGLLTGIHSSNRVSLTVVE